MVTSMTQFTNELRKLGFRPVNQWKDDTREYAIRRFTLWNCIAKQEIAMVLIMEYMDDTGGFEVFISAGGDNNIKSDLANIRKRFNLKTEE